MDLTSPSSSDDTCVSPTRSPPGRLSLEDRQDINVGKNYARLMIKVKDLERDRDRLMQGQNIINVFASGQKEMQKLFSSTQKRERPEKEASDEPVKEELLHKYTEFKDDNHSVFCREVRRLYKQPNKDPGPQCLAGLVGGKDCLRGD